MKQVYLVYYLSGVYSATKPPPPCTHLSHKIIHTYQGQRNVINFSNNEERSMFIT